MGIDAVVVGIGIVNTSENDATLFARRNCWAVRRHVHASVLDLVLGRILEIALWRCECEVAMTRILRWEGVRWRRTRK
jgi:hypothetical protein